MKRWGIRRWLRVWVLVMAFGGHTGLLAAQDTGISGVDLEFYQPAVDRFGFFAVNGPRLLEPWEFTFSLSQSVAFHHLFQVDVNGVPVPIVQNIATTELTSAVGLTNFLTIGFGVPFHPYAREANFVSLSRYTTASLGDLRIFLKFRLLKETSSRPGIAILVTNTFPTGNEMKFLGTSHMVPGVDFIVGKGFKYVSLAANIGARFPLRISLMLDSDFGDVGHPPSERSDAGLLFI